MRSAVPVLLVFFLTGCGVFFYQEDDLPGGGGSVGGNTPQVSISPRADALFANDRVVVTLSYPANPSATIYYTLDDSDPRGTGPSVYAYDGTPFPMDGPFSLRAVAGGATIPFSLELSTNLGGDGSEAYPYTVTQPRHLYNVRSNLSARYRQDADIDLSADYPNWVPMAAFTGVYDGNGYAIRNLSVIASGDRAALFASATNAVFRRMRLENSTVTVANFNYSGTLAGVLDGCTVDNCSASGGQIQGTAARNAGGLIGSAENCTIINCRASVMIDGVIENAGGLAGALLSGSVKDCFASGDVTGDTVLGGLIGYNSGTIENSGASGTVNGTGSRNGGLVGQNWGNVTHSFAQGAVSGTAKIGGLVGECGGGGTIDQAYATGDVTGTGGSVGGLLGTCPVTVNNAYSAGIVTGVSNTGALIGTSTGNYTSCFYDSNHAPISACGSGSDAGITGKSTLDMLDHLTFTGWDFTHIWYLQTGSSYPHFRWQGSDNIPNP